MIIDSDNQGKRIDKYLGENTEYTRSKIQKMIEKFYTKLMVLSLLNLKIKGIIEVR